MTLPGEWDVGGTLPTTFRGTLTLAIFNEEWPPFYSAQEIAAFMAGPYGDSTSRRIYALGRKHRAAGLTRDEQGEIDALSGERGFFDRYIAARSTP